MPVTRGERVSCLAAGIRLGGQHEEIHLSQMTAEVDPIGFVFPDAVFYVTEDGYVLTDMTLD